MKKIAMIGVGKLGQDCAEVMFESGYDVVGYDVEPRSPKFPMADTIENAVRGRDLIFIAAPTPHDPQYGGETPTSHLPNKDFDYSIVIEILKTVDRYVSQNQLIILISTVLPGTVRKLLRPCVTNARFIYNPYLIAMGTVKWDMVNPEMVIIGTEDGAVTGDAAELIDFYKVFMENDPRYEIGTWEEAESIKIFYNTFISTKLALVNMIQDVAECVGNMNVDVVTTALKNSTQRIMGPSYMTAGMGDAGACHPRDNIALRYLAENLDLGYDLFDAIMKAREVQTERMAKRCLEFGKNITIVGKAYKPGVHYTNGSAGLLLGYYIKKLGGNVHYYDENTGDSDIRPVWTDVYFIAYWDAYTSNISFPPNATVIDPWRNLDYKQCQGDIIHYGDSRPKKKFNYSVEFHESITSQVFLAFPELKKYKNKIHVIYASANTSLNFLSRSFEDIIDEINQAFSRGKTKIVFFNNPETLLSFQLYKIQRIVERFKNIKSHTFFLTTSGFDAEADYLEYCRKKNRFPKIKILSCNAYESITKNLVTLNQKIDYRITPRDKLFVCFNKVHRGHRIELFSKLVERNLLDKGYYSFEGATPNWIDEIDWRWFDESVKNNVLSNKHLFPFRLNISEDRKNPINITDDDVKYFSNSYISIVTETIYYTQSNHKAFLIYLTYKFFSEKVFKTIVLKHPFILVAWPGALKKLKELGYKTFHPYINEKYDEIYDDIKRMNLIIDEIERLSKFTESDWISFQRNVKPIVDHNHSVLYSRDTYNQTPNIDIFFKD